MDCEDNEITITLGDYLELRDKAVEYERLLNALFDECALGYSGSLVFNDYSLNCHLKYAVPDRYSRKIEEMSQQKASSDREC